MKSNTLISLAILIGVAVLAGIVYVFVSSASPTYDQDKIPDESNMPAAQLGGSPLSGVQSGGVKSGCASRAYDEIGGPFELIDQTGASVTQADFTGAPSLVFFGFTSCPQICPSTLVQLNRAYNKLPAGVTPPRTLFISIDPERDTPDVLADYLDKAVFPDDIVGLTGTPEQVKAVADEFIASFVRVDDPESLAEYTMDHTTLLYLMDENWEMQTFFSNATEDEIATCLTSQLK